MSYRTGMNKHENEPNLEMTDKERADGFFTSDGWFFLGNNHYRDLDQALGIYQADKVHVEQWASSLRAIEKFCASCGVPTLFLVAPAKWAIYSDKLENVAGFVPARKSTFQSLIEECDKIGTSIIDTRRALIDARSTAHTYSPRDSHWSGFGAAIVWEQISAMLSAKIPGLQMFDPFPILSVHYTDEIDEATQLTGQPGINRQARPVFATPFPPIEISFSGGPWQWTPGSQVISLANLPYRTRNAAALSDSRALIIRDSVGDQLTPFLHSAFRETIHTYHHINHLAHILDVPTLIKRHQPDVMVFMITERYLTHPWPNAINVNLALSFEEAMGHFASWPQIPASQKLSVIGWEYPKDPVLVEIPAAVMNAFVIRITLSSASSGTLNTSYQEGGRTVQGTYRYNAGVNEIYCMLPSVLDYRRFWLVDTENANPTVIHEISLREICNDEPIVARSGDERSIRTKGRRSGKSNGRPMSAKG